VTSASPERQLRALILAPRGRDAAVAQSLIELAGVRSAPCHDLPELVETLDDDVAFILMTEEAIRTASHCRCGWRASRHGPTCPSCW
jgi:hypothetical protein